MSLQSSTPSGFFSTIVGRIIAALIVTALLIGIAIGMQILWKTKAEADKAKAEAGAASITIGDIAKRACNSGDAEAIRNFKIEFGRDACPSSK